MKLGALDYIVKPFKIDEVRHSSPKPWSVANYRAKTLLLRRQLGERYGFGNLIGSDPRMTEIYEMIRRIAGAPTNVLITGDTGTGKELVARAIHVNSQRVRQPFVVINCGAIPSELLEVSCSVTSGGVSPAPFPRKKVCSKWPRAARSSWTKWGEFAPPMQVKLLRPCRNG
jgi:two-component system response regulator PilR (NtrC family)